MIHYNGLDARAAWELHRRAVLTDLQNRIREVERIKNWVCGILDLCPWDAEEREAAKEAFSMSLDLRKQYLMQALACFL
jgi:hypothetical protein